MEEGQKELSFEEALAELEATVARLEEGELTLEETLVLYERGQILAKYCNAKLEEAVLKVEQLSMDGEIISISVNE